MKIVKVTYKQKCDFPGCKKLSTNLICDELDGAKHLGLCEECTKNIYQIIGANIVPKGIQAPYKNFKKLR